MFGIYKTLRIKHIVIVIGFLISQFSIGQDKFPETTAEFIVEYSTYLKSFDDPKTDTALTKFVNVIESGRLQPEQIKGIISLTNSFYKKRFRGPEFTNFSNLISASVNANVSKTDLDTLIIATTKLIDIYDGRKFGGILETMAGLYESNTLYQNRYNSLLVINPKFRFRFIEEVVEEYVEEPEEEEEEEEEEESTEGEYWEEWDGGDEGGWDEWGSSDESEDETTTDETTETPKNMEAEGFSEELLDIGYLPPTQPAKTGAIIEFESVTLQMITAYDTVELVDTKGYLVLGSGKFAGSGGKFDWSSAGLGTEAHATFQDYNFNINSPALDAEGVTMNYQSKLEEPVEGVFSFRSKKRAVNGLSSYPRFMSYKSNVIIKDLGDNIKYTGGFSLNGARVLSNSVSEGKAKMEIYYDGIKKITARARSFQIGDSVITGQPVNTTVYIKNDSITHPGLMMRFDKRTNEVKLYKNKTNFKNTPFVDTYHQMELYADAIIWTLSDTLLNITNVTAKNYVPARFESELFYKKLRYTQIKGLLPFHPLQLVTYHSMRKKTRTLYLNELIEATKESRAVTPGALKSGMKALMEQGYIDYNPRTGYIYLKDKAIHYVKSARGKKDFDNISIKSIAPGGHNSSLNLNNNELIIRGVDKVELSDSLSVYFEPSNRIVRIGKNRDFTFDGTIYTANYIFNGHDFKFNYDNFRCDLEKIDSIQFKVDVKDTVTGRTTDSKKLNNKLVYTAGILYIDEPDNKSSRVRNARYPYFDADKGAFVYFNKKEVLNGAYDERVYFFIPPFDQDSLSSNNSEAVGFGGKFVSGDIFPEFEEKLVVRPDFSFGFEHQTPAEGFQLYKSNGTFYGTVSLDKKGLRGNGKIEFLNSTIESSEFVFYVDSVYAKSASVVTKKGTHPDLSADVKFPEMHLNDSKMNWYPHKDSLYLENKKTPFTFYDETATLDGKATITTKGMYGSGILKTRGSRTFSKKFHFEDNRYGGRESLFEILTDNPTKPALRSENCKLIFELDSAKAYFSPEVQGFASNSFPYLKYKSSIDKGVWDLEEKIIHMKKPEDADISSSYFYSTHPKQDSLVFNAESADYIMSDQTLNIMGVPEIVVADAYVIPDSNFVQIHENAKMETLTNAVLIVDTTYEYHKLYDGVLNIRSRSKLEGSALYEYINFGQDTFAIAFKSFQLEERETRKKDVFEYHTMSTGNIVVSDSFLIAPEIQYKGKVTMKADKRVLEFEGLVKLDFVGLLKVEHWLPYKNLDGSSEMKVDVTEPVSKRGNPLFAGLHLKSTGGLYSTFLDTKRSSKDRTIFDAKGVMMEDFETHEFKVASYEKIKGKQMEGNMLAYDETHSVIRCEGLFDFVIMAEGHEKNLITKFSGISSDSLLDSTKFINLMANIQFNMPSQAESKMGEKLKAYVEVNGGERCNLMTPEFKVKLSNMITDKKALEYEDIVALNYIGLSEFSNDLSKGVTITDANLRWSEQYNAWYSIGQIGLSSVGKTDVNTYMDGKLEIKHSLSGDIVNLYLQPNEETWYFLSYKDNALFAISSDEDFNKIITSKSQMDKNIIKGIYYFAPASPFEKQKFVNNFQGLYLGKDVQVIVDEVEETDNFEDDVIEDGSDDLENDEIIDDNENGIEEETTSEDETEDLDEDFEDEEIDLVPEEETGEEISEDEFYDPDKELEEEFENDAEDTADEEEID